mmetsp:Transcript_13871/g.43820  ORF Transcript_13871/g.43820 Transcript_13871/m.43820 type:complete len:339 (-) Transcript_13871:33-1049(-)
MGAPPAQIVFGLSVSGAKSASRRFSTPATNSGRSAPTSSSSMRCSFRSSLTGLTSVWHDRFGKNEVSMCRSRFRSSTAASYPFCGLSDSSRYSSAVSVSPLASTSSSAKSRTTHVNVGMYALSRAASSSASISTLDDRRGPSSGRADPPLAGGALNRTCFDSCATNDSCAIAVSSIEPTELYTSDPASSADRAKIRVSYCASASSPPIPSVSSSTTAHSLPSPSRWISGRPYTHTPRVHRDTEGPTANPRCRPFRKFNKLDFPLRYSPTTATGHTAQSSLLSSAAASSFTSSRSRSLLTSTKGTAASGNAPITDLIAPPPASPPHPSATSGRVAWPAA